MDDEENTDSLPTGWHGGRAFKIRRYFDEKY